MALLRRRRAATTDDEGATTTRRRRGGGAAAGAYGLLGVLATIVDLLVAIVALIIVVGIIFVVLKANMGNALVKDFHDVAKFLAGPFDGIFKPKDHKLAIAINWGIATAVYVIVGRFIASLLRRGRP